MEADTLTIAYYDEDNKWDDLMPYITSQLPLTEIFLSSASSDPCKIYPKFTRHEDSYWEVSFEEAFRKPYLWIYILNFTTFENFRQRSKPQIREMVNTIMEQQIEWLVLFLHPLSPSFKSQHKGIMKSYEKVAVEIGSMFGLKQCVKLFCNERKTFLSSDCPIDTCRGYFDELIKSFNQGISNSLSNRIAFFAGKISQVEETRDYNLFILMKEGLAMTYSFAGLKQEAKNTYEQIFSPPECYSPINFGPITEEELLRTSEISMKEFRNNNRETSHLYLRKYIFYCQKKLLEADEDYIGIGHLSLSFVCTSLGLFKSVETEHLKTQGSVWVYNHSLELAKYLQEKSKSNYHSDITDPEVRTVLHYSVGLMLSLVRSRLQILSRMKFNNYEIQLDLNFPCEFSFDRSPVKIEGRALKPKSPDDLKPLEVLNKSDLSLETVFETQYRLEEALHILTFSLFENFSQANYLKFAQRYRIEQGILLTYRGMYEQAGELLKNIEEIEWDTIQVIVLHNLLTCFINTGKHFEAVAAALKICRYAKLLQESTIPKLWNTIEEISHIHKCQDIAVDLFKVDIGLNSSKHQQGDIIEATCKFLNTLKCPVVFGKVFCQFNSAKNNGTLTVEAKNIRIEPGLNSFKLSGVASAQGRLKAKVLNLVMNNLNMFLSFPIISVNIEESSKFVSIIHKVPSLLVYNEVQLLAIEISTRHYSIECGSIELANSEQVKSM